MELDPDVVRAELHVRLGVGQQGHHAGVRDDDALGPAGRPGRVDHVGGGVPADLGGRLGAGRGRLLLPLHEHAGPDVRPLQQLREAVALLALHENDLRGRVGEDVRQAFVRVREVQRYVRAARADDGDQGDDLFHGARHGDGDPLARPDTGRAQHRRQLGLGGGQFAVRQGAGGAVQTALRDGGGGRITARGDVEERAQGRRGDRLGASAVRGGQCVDRGVGPGEQGGEHRGERVQDGPRARLPQQLSVIDQVEARTAVERALHHQGQRVVRSALVHQVADDQRVTGPPQVLDVGGDVEHDQGVEQGAGVGLAADPRQGDVLVRQYRALVCADRGEQLPRRGVPGPAGADGDGVDEQAHHVLDAGHIGVAPGDRGAEDHVRAVQDAAQRHRPGAVHGHAQRYSGRAGGRVDVGARVHRGVGEPVGRGVPLGDQGRAGQLGQFGTPDPVALVVVASGEPVDVVGEAADRVHGPRRVVLGQQRPEHGRHRPADQPSAMMWWTVCTRTAARPAPRRIRV